MELHLILLFMIFAAIVAVEMQDLISSVIALSAVGLGLSLAFLILKAPNLAIIQLVVEILCVIVLIRATINKDLPLVIDGRWFFNTVSTFIFIFCFLAVAFFALQELPVFGAPLMKTSAVYLAASQEGKGFLNVVNAISLRFRSFDYIGQLAVLLAAMTGVTVVIRKKGKTHGK
jgi:multicomponent Na+:H+ antiporter subunit B